MAANVFDGVIISLIVINTIVAIADTFSLALSVTRIFAVVEVVSVVIFTLEYLLRLWTADLKYPQVSAVKARFKHAFTFMALIDLLAILPFYLPFFLPVNLIALRMLRIIRLLRLFKMNRYTHALTNIGNVFKSKAHQLFSSILVVVLLMIIASVLMYNIEHEAQPEAFSNAFSTLWWAVATFTTVGYGDIYLVTLLGKILSAVIALLGIALVAVPTGIISAGFVEQVGRETTSEQAANQEPEKRFCPYCGRHLEK